MAESITLKPKFIVAYALTILLAIAALAILAYYNYIGEISADYFSLFSMGIFILAVIALLAVFLKYLALTYTISDHEVILSEGIITKTVRTVPIKKIDNISVKRGIRDLLMMTGSIHVDTPGGPGAEIVMNHVDSGRLHEIESKLKHLIGKEAHPPQPPAEPERAPPAPAPEEKAYEVPAEEFRPSRKPKKKEPEKPAKKGKRK